MNPENNLGNENQTDSMNSSTLGSVTLNNDVNTQPVVENTNPTSNLSSIGLENLSNNIANNQPSDMSFNPVAENPAPEQPVGLSDALNNVGNQNINSVPEVAPAPEVYNEAPQMPTPEVAPVNEPAVDNFNSAPQVEPVQSMGLNDMASASLNVENTQVLNGLNNPAPVSNNIAQAAEPIPEVPNQGLPVNEPVSGPTMPIPDTMPDVGYQAGVSTPVDYATPMSNFDEIGTTPELDPKAKMPGNKKGGKTLLFALIILAIAALGAGSYYLINVKHIFDKSSVKIKDLTVEQGVPLSENINDYATFSNTSSSNCVQDLSKVDINTTGTYVYTIKCGDKEYTGKITVKDSTAPLAKVKSSIVLVADAANITAESLIDSCYGEECSAIINSGSNSNITTKGIYPISIEVKDQSGNASDVIVPLIVIDGEIHYGLIASKDIASNDDYNIVEKDVVLYSDNGYFAYTMYQFTFNSTEMFNSQSGNDENGKINISDYSGIPVYKYDEMRITLVSDSANNLIQGSYGSDREALANVGFTVEAFGKDHVSILNY